MSNSGQQLLDYLSRSFDVQFNANSIIASLGTSFGVSLALFLIFCLVRPRNNIVYAPKLRQDEKHAPPRVSKGFFSWITPLIKKREADLVDKIGLDATIFLRFLRMLRSIFLILSVLGIVLIGVNVSCSLRTPADQRGTGSDPFSYISPQDVKGAFGKYLWAHVIMSYIFDAVICFFLYRNYEAVVKLKREWFESTEYQESLHSRTLMVTDVPRPAQSDEGLKEIVARIKVDVSLREDERATIARDVMELPKLIEQYETTVRTLEHVLAKYLRNPDRLPSKRPTMKVFKDDLHNRGGQKVDSIEYLDMRMQALEVRIKEIRSSMELKKPHAYGFVSYSTMQSAHAVGKAAHGKHPQGTTIYLAPRPNDILWRNLAKTKGARRWNSVVGWFYFVLLSALWIVPNAFIATFLANIYRIGALWPAFQTQLNTYPKFYALVQGFAAPLITSLIYILLPIIMRRISAYQGDLTKTSRERHVTSKLYVFFVFNNLILFTAYGTIWDFVITVIAATGKNVNPKDAILNYGFLRHIIPAVFKVSSFWVMYILQRNLGALLDLVQIFTLFWRWYNKTFHNPTPREVIEWTAPQSMDVAAYYNYFLFYATVALVNAPIQPLILPVAFIYFLIDSWLRKYSYMYVFVTKTESAGGFWRLLFNRMLFATGFANVITGCMVWVNYNGTTACGVLPLLIILIAFKFYCKNAFDSELHSYTKGVDLESTTINPKRHDKLALRYGHPSLTKKLIQPLVHDKAKQVLAQVYKMREGDSEPHSNTYGANPQDYDMPIMQKGHTGKAATDGSGIGQYAFVGEHQLDYANLDHRSEFGFSIYDNGSPGPSRVGTPRPRTPGPVEYSKFAPDGAAAYVSHLTSRGVSPAPQIHGQYDPVSPGFNSRRGAPYLNPAMGSESDLAGLLHAQQEHGHVTPGTYDLRPMTTESRGEQQQFGWQVAPTGNTDYMNPYGPDAGDVGRGRDRSRSPYDAYRR